MKPLTPRQIKGRKARAAKHAAACRGARSLIYSRRDQLKRYGLTLEEHAELLTSQGGVCAICHLPETAGSKYGRVKDLAVDHDHATGKRRELLCSRCNVSVGVIENKGLNHLTTIPEELIVRILGYLGKHTTGCGEASEEPHENPTAHATGHHYSLGCLSPERGS
jgi:hypothetical protein